MAYKVLTEKPLTTVALTAAEIAAQLISMGWTEYDAVPASSYTIYSSTGEASDKNPLYVKLDWSGSTVTMTLYSFWNETTHTTTAPSFQCAVLQPNKNLWVYGNKNYVVITQESAGVMSATAFFSHIVNEPADAVKTTTTASISIGASVSIPVTSVTGFEVGARYQIFDPTTGYRQPFTCTFVGTDYIVADSIVTNGSASGSIIGSHTFTAICGNSANTAFPTSFKSMNGHRDAGTGATYQACTLSSSSSDILYAALSMPYTGSVAKRRFFPPVVVENPSGSYRYCGDLDDGNGLLYIAPAFAAANQNDSDTYANYDAVYIGQIDSGTTTGSNTTTTLNDTGKTWTVNAYVNKVLVCTSGTEVGQIRKIVSNTATQLTVTPDFTTVPVSSTYVIADRAYRYHLPGWMLREGV